MAYMHSERDENPQAEPGRHSFADGREQCRSDFLEMVYTAVAVHDLDCSVRPASL